MTTLKIKGYTCNLTGDRLSGKTFEVKNYIKAYLDGRWDAANTEWIVDVEKVMDIASRPGSYIQIVEGVVAPAAATKSTFHSGWCNRCHSYCYGDCTAN
jgi:hypothetical protein